MHPVVVDVERHWAARRPRLARDAAPVDLELVVQELVPVGRVVEERRPGRHELRQERRVAADRVLRRVGVGVEVAAVAARRRGRRALAHLDGRAVQADELRVHRRVERAPVVPALSHGRPGRAAAGTDAAFRRRVPVRAPVVDRARDVEVDRVERRLVHVDARLVPLQPEVVVDPGVVRLRRRLDQRRRDVAVQVERLRREPLLHDPDRRLRLRLRLREEVAVEVEAVAVRALAGDAAIRVLDHVEDDDGAVEDRVHLWVGAVGRRGEALDRAHVRVHALELVAMDAALDVERHLDADAPAAELALRGGGVRERLLAQRRPVVERRLLRVGLQLVDHDLVHRSTRGGRAEHLEAHAAVEAARLDVGERAADRVDRDVREARAGRRQRLRGVRFRCSAPGRCDLGGGGTREAEQRCDEGQEDEGREADATRHERSSLQ